MNEVARDIHESLLEVFGHEAFRKGQSEIIEHVVAGTPTLAILPTGGGKSLCYQLPAVVTEGTALVISPLIALIRDQVTALQSRGVAAASLTSVDHDKAETLRALRDGELDLLYVAPERFRNEAFVSTLSGVSIGLVAIDEAHCISQWGHDFRPDYARLGGVLERLSPPRLVALTATATPEVRQDILQSLNITGATTIVTGFDRPNLELSVEEVSGTTKKTKATHAALSRWIGREPGSEGPGCGIVYVATRRRSEDVAHALGQMGWRAASYHAGMNPDAREHAQQAFNEGALDVVVATTAFGMGVDKSDVRVVVHYEMPSSVEAYYQEVGRGGRDGEPAGGVLLYSGSDLRLSFMRIESSCPKAHQVDSAFSALRRMSGPDDIVSASFDEVVGALEDSVGPAARASLIALERSGDIVLGRGQVAVQSDHPRINRDGLDRRARVERAKLDAMIGYVQRATCRRRYIVDYFGDPDRPDSCGHCDRCARPAARALEDDAHLDALKALSCVARMRGRYGKAKVADVLLGSRARPITDAGLDQLSTHGLLDAWTRKEVQALLDSLARAGLVEQTRGEYPKLQLTEAGADTIRQRTPISIDLRLLRWGDLDGVGRAKTKKTKGTPAGERGPLFEELVRWRRKIASEIAKPPYVIAHNSTLEAVCSLRPTTLTELADIPGIGPSKLESYGSAIVSIVAQHESSIDSSEVSP